MGAEQKSIVAQRGGAVAFALIALTTAFGNMSQTALNAMLPSMSADLGVDVAIAQWLSTSYMLVLGIAVPLSAFFAHRFGLRGTLLLALGMFGLGSAISYVAPNFAVALVGRILQAAAAGFTMPLVQTAAIVLFEPGYRATAMGISGIALGFAPNIGPTIGGVLADTWGWHSFFLLFLAAMVVLAVCTLLFVRKDIYLGGGESSSRLDLLSFTLSGIGFTGILLGFSNASSFGLTSPACGLPLIVGAAFVVLFVLRQKNAQYPIVDLRVFSSRHYSVGLICTVLLYSSFMGVTLLLPLFIEGYRGGTAIEAGLALFPGTITALICNPISGVLTDRIGARKVLLVGGSLFVFGACSAVLFTETTPLGVIMLLQGFRAAGVSLLISATLAWSLSELDHEILPGGSSFSVMVRQAAASFGTALMVLATTLGPVFGAGEGFGFVLAFGFSAFLAVSMFIVAFIYVK